MDRVPLASGRAGMAAHDEEESTEEAVKSLVEVGHTVCVRAVGDLCSCSLKRCIHLVLCQPAFYTSVGVSGGWEAGALLMAAHDCLPPLVKL